MVLSSYSNIIPYLLPRRVSNTRRVFNLGESYIKKLGKNKTTQTDAEARMVWGAVKRYEFDGIRLSRPTVGRRLAPTDKEGGVTPLVPINNRPRQLSGRTD